MGAELGAGPVVLLPCTGGARGVADARGVAGAEAVARRVLLVLFVAVLEVE